MPIMFSTSGVSRWRKRNFNLDGSKATSHADISADTVKGGIRESKLI